MPVKTPAVIVRTVVRSLFFIENADFIHKDRDICQIIHIFACILLDHAHVMTEKPISIISLGPGDPELLTLGALRDLQAADVIFCPTVGSADQGLEVSRAGQLLLRSGLPGERIRLFELGMHRDRHAALEAYDAVARAAIGFAAAGRAVAVAAEGDAGIFASVHYIGDRIAALGHEVRYRAGIPAFIAAGALAGLHLVKQRESLVIVPELRDDDHVERLMASGMTVVIMKLSQNAALVRAAVAAHPSAGWHYFENLGSPLECHLSTPDAILARSFPYFSLMILRPQK